MKFFSSIRLLLAGLAAIAVLSGCGDNGNPVAPSPQLDTTPPPAPENLTMVNDAYGHLMLVWTDSAAPDVVGYQVYVYSAASGGDDYVPANDAISVDNSFWLPSVTTRTEASYRVRAVDGAGNRSAFSAVVDIVLSAPGDPFEIE